MIRINILARELEVKARRILDFLPEIDFTEKKTHSSSLPEDIADKVRAHFRGLEKAEEEAVRKAEEDKKAAERAVVEKEAQEAAERAAAEEAAKHPKPPPPAPPTVPAPAQQMAAPGAEKKPSLPAKKPLVPGRAPARGKQPGRATPVLPGAAGRPARRPSPRATLGDVLQPGAGAPPPVGPVPGKPIYQRKAPAKPRPGRKQHLERRFDEGERRLMHPVRSRSKTDRGKRQPVVAKAPVPVQRDPIDITITEGITVKELAEKLQVRAKEVIKALMGRGTLATINQTLESKTATEISETFNATVTVVSFEDQTQQPEVLEEIKGDKVPRAPVVTVMGHVDHGKTSLLDAIRETDVVGGEAGGITQHIGAYSVTTKDRRIVFVDTPGHEAFTRMRARGASVTDIVILVVAADDGVMPQTLEAIDHAKAAGVPIIVAVNKIDKPGAEPDRVKKQLADRGQMPEDWGGDTVMVNVSAKEKTNLNQLLEMVLLVADMKELKAVPEAAGRGVVLEARLDKGRGPVATVLVQDGTMRRGDPFIVGPVFGKVRAMLDDHGHQIKEAGPSSPVEVLGLASLPEAGDPFQVVTDEVKAKQVATYREQKAREAQLASSSRLTLDHLHEQLEAGEVKELPLVIKGDVQGSVEALREQLENLATEQVKVKIIHTGVGGITENDVLLASASNAIIVGFSVRPDRKATDVAEQEGVDIRLHSVIYEVIDEINKAVASLLEPTLKETMLGRAEIRDSFRIPKVGMIAGCYVTEGKLVRDAKVRVIRDNVVIYDSKVSSLRRFKEDVKEVQSGYECGASVSNFSDVKVGDILEAYIVEEVAVLVAQS
jgi:translation initiation factor IF-2